MANVVFRGPAGRKPQKDEALAAATTAIKPGRVIRKASGAFTNVFATDGKTLSAFLYVADVNVLDGIAYTYATGDTVQAYIPESGQIYQLEVATSQTIAIDSPLTVNAAGQLRLAVVGTDDIVAYAQEAITTTASVGYVDAKIK